MNTISANTVLTPLEIIKAVECLNEEDKETLSILADKKLSEEILKRRKSAYVEMKKGTLMNESDLFDGILTHV